MGCLRLKRKSSALTHDWSSHWVIYQTPSDMMRNEKSVSYKVQIVVIAMIKAMIKTRTLDRVFIVDLHPTMLIRRPMLRVIAASQIPKGSKDLSLLGTCEPPL